MNVTNAGLTRAARRAGTRLQRPADSGLLAVARTGRGARRLSANPLAAVIVLSVGLRLLSVGYQGNTVMGLPGIHDQLSYHELALRVAEGHGFSFADGHWPATRGGEPTAHWSFLYTLFLAAVYSVFGVAPIVARTIQAVVAGVLHPWLTYRVTTRIFDPPVGTMAAVLSAAYAYFVYYAGGLLTETFYFLAILWTLDAAFRLGLAREPGRARRWVELGVAVGVTVLLRQVFLLFVPFLFAWLWWRVTHQSSTRGRHRPWTLRHSALRGLALSTAVVALLIGPWTLRNYRAFGVLVPLNTNAGFALFWGNHPVHGTEFQPLLEAAGVTYQSLIPVELRPLNEGQLDRALMGEALKLIAADPVRFLRLSASRTAEYFKFWPSPDSSRISNVARVGSFGLLLPFVVYGMWRSVRRIVAEPDSPSAASLLLLHAFAVTYTAIHLASWTLIRYRLPIDTVLVVFAAAGLVAATARCEWIRRPLETKGRWLT